MAVVTTVYFASSQKFRLTGKGLKPSTNHTFYFDNVDQSGNCQPVGKILGSSILTDTSGNVIFDFYYSTGLPSTSTDVTAAQALANAKAGNKKCLLKSADNNSQANCLIKFVSGTVDTGITPVGPAGIGIGGGAGAGGGGGGGGGGGCFTGDTKILMSNGKSKKLKDVKIGDLVYNYDKTKLNEVKYVEYQVLEVELYSPDHTVPFATKDHPIYSDNGVLSSPYPMETYNLYPWLGKTEALTKMQMTAPINLEVYNLWVDGDGTYTVNGWGTTSIVGDGGGIRMNIEMGLFTHDSAMKYLRKFNSLSHTLPKLSKYILYGGYIYTQKISPKVKNVKARKRALEITNSDSKIVNGIVYTVLAIIGAGAILNNKIRQKL